MRGLLAAVGFLTRIPVPSRVFADSGALARSLPWYPLVGLLISAVVCCIDALLPDSRALLAAALVLLAWVWLTGALHLDGLADMADAWVGGMAGDADASRVRTLEIMKDPRSGPAAVTTVVLVLLLKFTALASLPAPAWAVLWMAPMLARMAVVAAFATTPYVRGGGIGSGLADAPHVACAVSLLVGVALCGLAGVRGLIALAAVAVVFWLWRRACVKRLGGITGDTAGALIEMSEAAALVALALA